jgi:hypothetical protein
MRKAAISAGALHPVDALLISGPNVDGPIVYDDESDSFLTLSVEDDLGLGAWIASASNVVPSARGHLLLLVGDASLVSSIYENAHSLLWRDGGAALQTLSMTAMSRGLAFCPLGLLGDDALRAIAGDRRNAIAIGTAIIGRPG